MEKAYTVCAEKKNNGLEALLMAMLNSGMSVTSAATDWKPESTPPASGSQGEAKLDCVTDWDKINLEHNFKLSVADCADVVLSQKRKRDDIPNIRSDVGRRENLLFQPC